MFIDIIIGLNKEAKGTLRYLLWQRWPVHWRKLPIAALARGKAARQFTPAMCQEKSHRNAGRTKEGRDMTDPFYRINLLLNFSILVISDVPVAIIAILTFGCALLIMKQPG